MLAASFLVTVFHQHKTVRGCVIANVSHRKNAERRVLNVAACWTEELCSFVFACCASPTLSHDLLPLSHFLFLPFFQFHEMSGHCPAAFCLLVCPKVRNSSAVESPPHSFPSKLSMSRLCCLFVISIFLNPRLYPFSPCCTHFRIIIYRPVELSSPPPS